MSWADTINGAFETLGGFVVLLSVRKLHQQKMVRGVDYRGVCFFTAWGIWNLAFYSHLDQWLSLFGAAFLATVNAIWLCQLIYYTRKEG